ncbi:hypothetical protein P8452_01370 [Trifolium repens]|nr:hypothetical protein P8452_01370 [Trifolium repens]
MFFKFIHLPNYLLHPSSSSSQKDYKHDPNPQISIVAVSRAIGLGCFREKKKKKKKGGSMECGCVGCFKKKKKKGWSDE